MFSPQALGTHNNTKHALIYKLILLTSATCVGGGSPLLTPEIVRDLRDGVDNTLGTADDCLVIGYISIGEDYGMANPNTPGFNDPRCVRMCACARERVYVCVCMFVCQRCVQACEGCYF